MKNVFKTIGIIAFAAIVAFAMAGCSSGGAGGDSESVSTYTWSGSDGNEYELVTTEISRAVEQTYSLTVSLNGTTIASSSGTFSGTASNMTLTPNTGSGKITVQITVNGNSITVIINGTIGSTTLQGGNGTRSGTTTPMPPVEMVYVSGGTFDMGKNLGTGGGSDRAPVHTVTLSGFYIGKYEVTQAQYQAVMGSNPSFYRGGSLAVGQVTWYEAIEFCNKLSVKEGFSPYYTIDKVNKDPNNRNTDTTDYVRWTVATNANANGYRLPTEAQWEYAAKGGNPNEAGWTGYTYSGSNNADEVAWHSGNHGDTMQPVGTKNPNGLDLYDMSGNVFEWCWDWYDALYYSASGNNNNPTGPASGAFRVVRGGNLGFKAADIRSVDRDSVYPNNRNGAGGFRVVRP